MSLDAIAPPLDIAALVYFALAVFIYRVIVARRAQRREEACWAPSRSIA